MQIVNNLKSFNIAGRWTGRGGAGRALPGRLRGRGSWRAARYLSIVIQSLDISLRLRPRIEPEAGAPISWDTSVRLLSMDEEQI